jgi:hypothetical protein
VCEIPALRDSTTPGVTGSTAFWLDKGQTYCFTSDDPIGQIHVICRSDGQMVGSFRRVGRGPGEFENLHSIAIGSKGNIYTAEMQGQRVQRFPTRAASPRSANNSALRMKTGRSSTGAPGLRDPTNKDHPPESVLELPERTLLYVKSFARGFGREGAGL